MEVKGTIYEVSIDGFNDIATLTIKARSLDFDINRNGVLLLTGEEMEWYLANKPKGEK